MESIDVMVTTWLVSQWFCNENVCESAKDFGSSLITYRSIFSAKITYIFTI